MPPITFIDAQAFTAALEAPVPRRARPGDLLLAAVLTTHTADLELPDGWEQLARLAAPTDAAAAVWLVRHRVTDAEPASHAFAVDAGDAWGAVLLYRGLAEVAYVAAQANDQASATGHAAPAVTPTTYSDLLLCVWGTFTARTWTPPGNMTERFDAENPGAATATLAIADRLPESTSSTGTETATASSACTAIACAFLLAATPPPHAVSIVRPTPGAIGIQEV